jgi:hypothetical protein
MQLLKLRKWCMLVVSNVFYQIKNRTTLVACPCTAPAPWEAGTCPSRSLPCPRSCWRTPRCWETGWGCRGSRHSWTPHRTRHWGRNRTWKMSCKVLGKLLYYEFLKIWAANFTISGPKLFEEQWSEENERSDVENTYLWKILSCRAWHKQILTN